MRRIAIMVALLAIGCRPRAEAPVGSRPAAKGTSVDGGRAPSTQAAQPSEPAVAKPAQPPEKVTLRVRVYPPVKTKVTVHWGRKLLGKIPLQIERQRDGGPLDLVLRAEGYFPVHARAYTDRNDTLTVKLTKLTDRMTLFGAKQELPPPDPTVEQPAPSPSP